MRESWTDLADVLRSTCEPSPISNALGADGLQGACSGLEARFGHAYSSHLHQVMALSPALTRDVRMHTTCACKSLPSCVVGLDLTDIDCSQYSLHAQEISSLHLEPVNHKSRGSISANQDTNTMLLSCIVPPP